MRHDNLLLAGAELGDGYDSSDLVNVLDMTVKYAEYRIRARHDLAAGV